LTVPGSGLDGEEVEAKLLDGVSSLGSGTRAIAVWPQSWAEPGGSPCLYLHGVADPGNVGTIVRTAHALLDGTVVLGPGCADPFGPKAVRASMGSIFGQPIAPGDVGETPAPRAALVAHGGEPLLALEGATTLCLGAEREGLPDEVLAVCETRVTIPLRAAAESLNVAAVAAICAERISSLAMPEGPDGN
jgi:TrmH family RNA methyltransferase